MCSGQIQRACSETLGDANLFLDEGFKSYHIVVVSHLLADLCIKTSLVDCMQSSLIPATNCRQHVKSEGMITHRGSSLTYMKQFIMHR